MVTHVFRVDSDNPCFNRYVHSWTRYGRMVERSVDLLVEATNTIHGTRGLLRDYRAYTVTGLFLSY